MKTNKKTVLLLFILTFFAVQNFYSQKTNLKLAENNLCKLYSNISKEDDLVYENSEKFEKEFIKILKENPSTLDYDFKTLIDKKYCYVKTSSDGNFRIYSWDTETGGTMHFFKTVYQYKNNSKVYLKVPTYEEGDAGAFCSKIFDVKIGNKNFYLPITNGIFSTKDASQSISVFNIEGNKLVDSEKLFKTKTKTLNRIDVEFDFFSVVDRPERPLQLITFDAKRNIIYIPVVNEKLQVTEKYFLYQLSDNLFKYIGIEKGKKK